LSSTLQLQSSSTLGSGRALTAQEKLNKTEDKEVRRAIYSHQRRGGHSADAVESDGDDEVVGDAKDVHSEGDTIQDFEGTSSRDQVVVVDSTSTSTATRKQDVPADIIVGGALQRNADGSIAKPRIMKKSTSVCLVSPL
jgi:ATP-dependent RNA helicase DHX37/DHR1